ncbi:MAG: TetR/AcrR family transcriptional regulator [Lachnospiraceae bacterium]|nr:TetR/AcrR family transcriptional regulator [Lachnospiraceae bacterium]
MAEREEEQKKISELREKCVKQTIALLGEGGLKFKMIDLANALGVSKKTLYRAFDSKEELLLAVAENCFWEIKCSERRILEDAKLPLLEKIKNLIIVLPEQYRSLNWYLVEEVAARYPAVYGYIRKRMESDWDPTLDLLALGVQQGVLREFDKTVFKSMVEGCMEHFITSNELGKQGIGYLQALEKMIDILLHGIVGMTEERTAEERTAEERTAVTGRKMGRENNNHEI